MHSAEETVVRDAVAETHQTQSAWENVARSAVAEPYPAYSAQRIVATRGMVKTPTDKNVR